MHKTASHLLFSASGCTVGWMNSDTACYWVSNSSDPSQLMSWQDASKFCGRNQTGATLMTVTTQDDAVPLKPTRVTRDYSDSYITVNKFFYLSVHTN